jgi:mono/diheme cytochrome c family protein
VHKFDCRFARYNARLFFFALILGLGILGLPSTGHAQNGVVGGTVSAKPLIHDIHAIRGAFAAADQDAGQAAPPATSPAPQPAPPKKVELPEGDGKPIATEYCQDCHRLTNLSRGGRSLDDWRDTVQLMIDRGARLPPEDVDTLVQYLAKNFGPKAAAPAPDATVPAASPAPDAQKPPTPSAPAAPSTDAPPAAPAQPKKVELPEGDGKAIATENCQLCHRLTNLVNAHKSLDDWRDTVQLMTERGAAVPPDQVETLVQYLAKNFGPKAGGPGTSASSGGTPSSPSPQSQ